MRKPAAPTADLAGWCRATDRRVTAVETELQWLRNLLALSSFAVPLPPRAERDERLRRPSRRIPFQRRPKLGGHL